MMTSMKRKVAVVLAAVSLMTVATGALADYGDADKDKGKEPRYKVGQYVEVYNTPAHWTTTRSRILKVKKAADGHWTYEVDQILLNAKKGSHDPTDVAIPDMNKHKKVSADYIESK